MWPNPDWLVVVIKSRLLYPFFPLAFTGLIDLEEVRCHIHEESGMCGVHWVWECYPELVLMSCYVSEFMREPVILVRWACEYAINFGITISPPVKIHLVVIDFLSLSLSETHFPLRFGSINYKIKCFIHPVIPISFDFPFTGWNTLFPGCLLFCLLGGCLGRCIRGSLHLSFYELHLHGLN